VFEVEPGEAFGAKVTLVPMGVRQSGAPVRPAETKDVNVTMAPSYLSISDESSGRSKVVPGTYTFMVGSSSRDLPLTTAVTLK